MRIQSRVVLESLSNSGCTLWCGTRCPYGGSIVSTCCTASRAGSPDMSHIVLLPLLVPDQAGGVVHFTLSGFICLSRLHSPSPHLTYLTMFLLALLVANQVRSPAAGHGPAGMCTFAPKSMGWETCTSPLRHGPDRGPYPVQALGRSLHRLIEFWPPPGT